MALVDELKTTVAQIFREKWKERVGQVVPELESLTLGNDAVELDAAVLYADLSGSTKMVDTYYWWYAAEIYKAYLHCASKIIRAEEGTITAFDGDRVMAVFIGGSKNTNAVRCAMKIKYAVSQVINPLLAAAYPRTTYHVEHVVGIATSTLRAARTGVWGANDLVWVGSAANHAAKLSSLSSTYTYITESVYEHMNAVTKFTDGKNMWEAMTWNAMGGQTIYRTSWWWEV